MTGQQGEALAREALVARGYEIIDTGFRTEYGEIDIVARHGDVLVFVEVRTRYPSECGSAVESVTLEKQWHVSRAASAYLVSIDGYDGPCRFDVVAIDYDEGGMPEIVVYEDAFESRY